MSNVTLSVFALSLAASTAIASPSAPIVEDSYILGDPSAPQKAAPLHDIDLLNAPQVAAGGEDRRNGGNDRRDDDGEGVAPTPVPQPAADTEAEAATPKAKPAVEQPETWKWTALKLGTAYASSTLYTERATHALLDGVQAGVTSFMGSWAGYGARVLAFNWAYDAAETGTFLAGYKAPDAAWTLGRYATGQTDAVDLVNGTVKTGVKVGSAAVASYGMTFPVINGTSNAVYYTLVATGNPYLAHLGYYGIKGFLTHTRMGNKLAMAIGYNAPDALVSANSAVKKVTGVDVADAAKKAVKETVSAATKKAKQVVAEGASKAKHWLRGKFGFGKRAKVAAAA